MKLIGIGDCVVDYYKDQEKIYPGGNALNVALFSKRNGASHAAYMGIIGRDVPGEHIIECLNSEKIDVSRIRIVECPTGIATVSVNNDGDRVFIATNKEVRAQSMLAMKFNREDLEYINQFDLIHTSINSSIEHELEKLANKPISFDFSTTDRFSKEYLKEVCPYLTYAFFSGGNLTETESENLIKTVHGYGVRVVGITRGEKPAILSEKGEIYKQVPVPTVIMDTMGAGDSFIGAFLTNYHEQQDMTRAIESATKFASKVCGYYGAFGYGKKYVSNV